MKSQDKIQQQHSLPTIQVKRKPVKEVPNPLNDKPETWEVIRGLSWTLFEEKVNV